VPCRVDLLSAHTPLRSEAPAYVASVPDRQLGDAAGVQADAHSGLPARSADRRLSARRAAVVNVVIARVGVRNAAPERLDLAGAVSIRGLLLGSSVLAVRRATPAWLGAVGDT
jgi:hypothetical protein